MLICEPAREPVFHHRGAQRLVEIYGCLVPVKNLPFQAWTIAFRGNTGQRRQEQFANALTAKMLGDE